MPKENRKWWSEAEMRILRAGQTELGNKWAEIAKRIPGRTARSCKKSWNDGLASQKRKERAQKKRESLEEQNIQEQHVE